MRVALLFFLAVCVVSALGQRTAVDLWFNEGATGSTPGYVSLPQTKIGSNGVVAFEIQGFLARAVSGKSSLIKYGVRDTTALDVEVYLVGNNVNIRLGSSVVSSSYSAPIVQTWTYIAVNIVNGANSASAQLFVNGVDHTASLSNGGVFANGVFLPSEPLNNNFLGYSTYGGVSHWRGLVDMFAVWAKALTLQTVQNHAVLGAAAPAWEPQGLIVRYDFTETTGKNSRGKIGTSCEDALQTATLSFPNAVFSGGAFIGWTWCNGWGDPHWTDVDGRKFDTYHVEGFFNDLQCKNSAGTATNFQVATWHTTGCCWGGATVIRAVNVRLGDTIVQWAGQQAIDNNIPGPWVWKQVPAGVNPSTVGWTPLSIGAGSSVTLGDGIVVELASSGSSFRIIGIPYGYVSISDTGNYANMDIYVNEATCLYTGVNGAVCNGGRSPVGEWVFNGEPVTPVPMTVAPPADAPPPQVCEEQLLTIAQRSCQRCFPNWATTQQEEYAACLGDVCLTGDPYCPPPPCQPGQPCCTCASTGTCIVDQSDNSTSCTCDNGYGGPDCSQVLDLVSLTLETATTLYDGRPYILTPHNLGDAVDTKVPATGAALAAVKPWFVKNSLLAYVGTVAHMDAATGVTTYSQHLYVVGDATSFPTGIDHSLAVTYPGTTLTNAATAIGSGASFTGNAAMPSSVRLDTAPTGYTGFVLPNLPNTWCVRMVTDATFGTNQVLVGSGNIRGQLDVLRVVSTSSGFEICGEKKTNPCADLLNCADCTANAECGWCRTTGTCRYGRPAGPTDGTLCPAWAFTFADMSRRITESYGYAVSPVDTTVVLSSNDLDTLPIEIKVDMAYRFSSAWDVQIMFPRGPNNQNELTHIQASIANIADFFRANYPTSALSVGAYASRPGLSNTAEANGDTGVYKQVFPLVTPDQPAQLQALLNNIGLVSTASTSNVQLSLALSRAGATQHAGWRTNARHMLIVFATTADVNVPAQIAQARSDLLAYSVLPVFVVLPSVKADYVNYVNALGFGLVIDYTAPSSMGQLVDRAMADASKSISLTVDDTKTGRVDFRAGKLDTNNKPTLTFTGLQQRMRGRAVIPVAPNQGNDDYTVVLAPGFGKATIEAIESDSPYTNGREVRVVVDDPLDPYTTHVGTLVYLTGKPADVLNSNAQVQAHFWSLTQGKGRVFQFDEAALMAGTAPTALVEIPNPVTPSSYTPVTDVQGRVIYVPPNNEFGNAADVAYARITYKVSDECSDSPNGDVPIFVAYDNNESPTTSHAAVNTNENQAVVVNFVGVDTRQHDLTAVITKIPTNTVGNTTILHGHFYAYSTACWNAVSANFRDVSGCGAALAAGAELTAHTTLHDGFVYTSTASAIYVPHEYANSEGKPAVYRTLPSVEYKFVQIRNQLDIDGGFPALETGVSEFKINIAAVNQAPSAKYDASFATWLSWPSTYVVPDAAACTTTDNEPGQCVYAQNLGVAYPSSPSPEPLVLFGADIEQENLMLQVVSVSCASNAKLESFAFGSQLANGQDLNDRTASPFAANGWKGMVRFLPAQDGAGNDYCKFTYRVFDGELWSEDTNEVSIRITFVPQPPRSENYRIFAPLIVETPFEFAARSVNDLVGDAVQAVYVSSVTVKSCSGDLTSVLVIDGQTINCAALPQVVAVTDNNADIDVVSGKQHTFSGAWTPTALSVDGFSIVVSYHDTHSPSMESQDYTLSFSYRHVNVGPQFRRIESPSQGAEEGWGVDLVHTIAISLDQGTGSASLDYHTRDPDSAEGDVTLFLELVGDIDPVTILFRTSGFWTVVEERRRWFLIGTIDFVELELAALSVNLGGVSEHQVNITLEIHDGGLTGACSADDVNPCDKFAKGLIIVKATTPTNALAIGLAAGAGGAALAAAAAAAIAWRALREPPTETYNPWEMDDAVEGTVLNPLFESAGNSGDNPIFESAGVPAT